MKKRLLVTSDIHGCYDEFIELLEISNYNPAEDQLILLGDYIDRGPKSRQVVEKVIHLVEQDGAIALMGNHEDMLFMYWTGEDVGMFLHNGGEDTLDSYKGDRTTLKRHIDWMANNLKLYHETNDYIFVHAGVIPGIPMKQQNPANLLWQRHNQKCRLGKLIIHGHTPVKDVVQINDQLCIDTGGVFNMKFSIVELPSKKVFTVLPKGRE